MPGAGGHRFVDAKPGEVPPIGDAEDVSHVGADAAPDDEGVVRGNREVEPTTVAVGDGVGDEGTAPDPAGGEVDDQETVVRVLDHGEIPGPREGDASCGAGSLKETFAAGEAPEADAVRVAQGDVPTVPGDLLQGGDAVGPGVDPVGAEAQVPGAELVGADDFEPGPGFLVQPQSVGRGIRGQDPLVLELDPGEGEGCCRFRAGTDNGFRSRVQSLDLADAVQDGVALQDVIPEAEGGGLVEERIAEAEEGGLFGAGDAAGDERRPNRD